MKKPTVFADHLILQVLANQLHLEIIVLRDNGTIVAISPPENIAPIARVTVVLHGGYHYEGTEPLPENNVEDIINEDGVESDDD